MLGGWRRVDLNLAEVFVSSVDAAVAEAPAAILLQEPRRALVAQALRQRDVLPVSKEDDFKECGELIAVAVYYFKVGDLEFRFADEAFERREAGGEL